MQMHTKLENPNVRVEPRTINFDEPGIRLLEAHWGELRDQAEVYLDENIWRIRFRRSQSLFEPLGFTDGQRLPLQPLLEKSRECDGISKEVVERWLALFEHLGLRSGTVL